MRQIIDCCAVQTTSSGGQLAVINHGRKLITDVAGNHRVAVNRGVQGVRAPVSWCEVVGHGGGSSVEKSRRRYDRNVDVAEW